MPSLDVIVDQYINYLILEKGLSKNTIESYSRDISRYVEYLKQKGGKQISDAD
ncbi:site-specific integrase, partial [Candidatus Desulfatibia sp.]|uniref:site-specific integrase n=1 Tax=Candidatus Desulfatibia sp. TaxID=3101189 RepID=UPI0039B9AD37